VRAVIGRPTTLTVMVADALGNPTQVDDATDVTVDIFDGAGVAVVAGALATDDAVTGVYSYVLAPRPELDTFNVVWHATVGGYPETIADTLRLVGNRVLSPADIAADDVLQGLTPARRGEVLDSVEDLLADVLGFPAVLEGTRVDFDARRGTFAEGAYGSWLAAGIGPAGLSGAQGGERLIVPGVVRPQQVFSLSINGTAAAIDVVGEFRAGTGFLIWTGSRSWPSGHYEMWLSHGLPYVPGDLRDAAATLARYMAKRKITAGKMNSLLPERTASLTTEGAVIVFAVPTPDRPTGLPEVDSVLARYRIGSVI
jgi:hypothetical protein